MTGNGLVHPLHLHWSPTTSHYIPFLTAYPHPAFVLASVPSCDNKDLFWVLAYTNEAFSLRFQDAIGAEPSNFINSFWLARQREEFKQWIGSEQPTISLEILEDTAMIVTSITKTKMNELWVCTTVPHARNAPRATHQLSATMPGIPGEVSFGDHTSGPIPRYVNLDESISTKELMETFDWSATPLGPRDTWSRTLENVVRHVMSLPSPSGLWWGPEGITIYNDAYIAVVGSKHPRMWGKPVRDAFAEIWDLIKDDVRAVFQEGKTVTGPVELFFLNRLTEARLPEEVYLTWNYTPVRESDGGAVAGSVGHCYEVTDRVIAKRRTNSLRDILTTTVSATSLGEFSDLLLQVLSKDVYIPDVSFAALYFCTTCTSVAHSSSSPNHISTTLQLSGTIGIPDGHSSVPHSIPFQVSRGEDGLTVVTMSDTAGSLWPFQEAIATRTIVHVTHLDDSLVSGYQHRSWGDRPREAVVIPIGFSGIVPAAILILGLNTRRPYDAGYRGDVEFLNVAFGLTLNATLSRGAEVKRVQQLAELNTAKAAFFSNVSHELRTPLMLIGGPLENCIGVLPDGPVKLQLKMAHRNVHRLKRLVDSLMDFSKLAANKLEGQFKPTRLGLFTANVASLFRDTVEQSGLTYRIECDISPTELYCYVDQDMWEKIVFNLISNAFKFTLSGTITVSVLHSGEHAILTVEDTGVGIPQDDLPKVFDRFHRVQSTSRSYEGTGIGLALTKELVTLHGGEISVESRFESVGPHGTKFIVKIPFGKDHLPKTNLIEQDWGSSHSIKYAQSYIHESSPYNEDMRLEEWPLDIDSVRLDPSKLLSAETDVILLVDDNADMRQYIKSILGQYCTVIEASNGQDALDLASSTKPNVVLSDIMMPVMNGFSLLNELRNKKETRLIPVIFITARSGEDCQVEGLFSGADDYLTKPFRSAELIARVHLQIQLGKKRVEMEDMFFERTLEIQQLTELSPVAIMRADPTGCVTYVNPRWYDITDCPPIDSKGQHTWLDSVCTEDRKGVLEWWKSACEGTNNGPPKSVDFRWLNDRWCKGQSVSLGSRGALGAFTDISSQKKLEAIRLATFTEKEAEARQRAEEAEKRRKDAEDRRREQELLVDVTSHELRQPVSAILNCSSLVRANIHALYQKLAASNGTFQPSKQLLQSMSEDLDALDAIYQCGLAQERIANDVLSLSRLQLNGLSIQPAELNLEKEMHRIVTLFRNEVQMKRIKLSVDFGASLGILGFHSVVCDRARFAQIVTNLLSNAVKFTDTSGDKREILVKVDVGSDAPLESCGPPIVLDIPEAEQLLPGAGLFIFVSVRDSGPGLEPEDLAVLFQRFQQGSNSHNVFGGSGLGLFVSRQLCTLMGGRIEVTSTPGQGAEFRFFIQATVATPASDPSVLLHPTSLLKIDAPNPIHVLITEDNLINQNVLNRQLTKAGCTTVLASDGQQAIAHILSSSRSFDVILMDVEMPVLDGVSAVRRIREMEDSGQLPRRHRIIALTANAREGQVHNIRQAGMDDIVLKPYRIEEVLSKLRPPSA